MRKGAECGSWHRLGATSCWLLQSEVVVGGRAVMELQANK